jgi:outer membrane protein TolC
VAAAEVQVKKAEEALKEAVKLQSAGLLTKGEVLQLEVALDSARAALDELQYRHAILMTAYRNLTGREILPPSLTEAADDGLD